MWSYQIKVPNFDNSLALMTFDNIATVEEHYGLHVLSIVVTSSSYTFLDQGTTGSENCVNSGKAIRL